jgi:enoyl-CoA hydratase/carnithine racemase
MSENPIGYRLEGTVATLRFDDGKANALSPAAIDGLSDGLDRAEKEAGAVLLAEIYTPEGAVDAGYLDRIVPPESLVEEAIAEAERLAALPRRAFSETKQRVRGASVERIRQSLADEMGTWGRAGS